MITLRRIAAVVEGRVEFERLGDVAAAANRDGSRAGLAASVRSRPQLTLERASSERRRFDNSRRGGRFL